MRTVHACRPRAFSSEGRYVLFLGCPWIHPDPSKGWRLVEGCLMEGEGTVGCGGIPAIQGGTRPWREHWSRV